MFTHNMKEQMIERIEAVKKGLAMMLNGRHKHIDYDDPNKRLKLQYQAMIQQGIMAVIGIGLMIMGFRKDIASTNGMIMALCGFLLAMMGVLRFYVFYRLFQEKTSDNTSDLE